MSFLVSLFFALVLGMATIKWGTGVALGTGITNGQVLTTEMNSLTNGSFTAVGGVYDNTSNKDRWGWLEFAGGGSITPTAGAVFQIYLINSLDGTNYDDAASSTQPGTHQLVAVITVKTGAGTKRAVTQVPFSLPPSKFKFVLKNSVGVTLSASGNVLTLYVSNEAVN